MNYSHHYNKLILRAKNRILEGYSEKHHIVPRCLNGTDNPDNIVTLTPEEHFVAHQLLVKMYPEHPGLVWAALQMTGHSSYDGRINNKAYGWLKRKHSKNARRRVGKNNGSYGKLWYYNEKTGEAGKFAKDQIPAGWKKGRCPKRKKKCQVCKKEFEIKKRKEQRFCSLKCFWKSREGGIAFNKKTVSKSDVKSLYERYKKGEPVKQLHKEYDVSMRKAYYLIQEYERGVGANGNT